MGRIVVSENLSLDGVIQDPTGEEGFERGGWFNQMGNKDREAWAKVELEETLGTEALLLGRRSYEFFAARWPDRNSTFADRLNNMRKYVVSSSLVDPKWNNSTVIGDKGVSGVSALKQKILGDIVVYASLQLVHVLLEHNLVDELRLIIYPSMLGAGKRLFGNTSAPKSLRLVRASTVGECLVMLVYELKNKSRE